MQIDQDKILSVLKEKIGKTDLNDKTLNAYVGIIADKITDESQISTALEPFLHVLTEFQGNINNVASNAVKNIKPPKSTIPSNPPIETDEKKYLTKEELDELMRSRDEQYAKKEAHSTLLNRVRSQLAEKGLKPRLLEKLLSEIDSNSDHTIESAIKKITTEYDAIQGEITPSAGRPASGGASAKTISDGASRFIAEKKAKREAQR